MGVRNTIKELVDSRGLTVYQFRQQTGLAKATAYRLYRNPDYVPTGDILKAICRTYGVQPGDILKYEPDEKE